MERYTIRAAGFLRALREVMGDTATTSIAPEYLNDDGTYPEPDAPFEMTTKKYLTTTPGTQMIFTGTWPRRRWYKRILKKVWR